MKDLSNLSPNPGSHRNTKRLGRGIGSGTGKTAAKGHKGQKARKSGGIAAGFEGGQTPLYRRLPKRGFTNASFRVDYTVLNLADLNRFDEGATVDLEALKKSGLVKSSVKRVKVLANGALDKKLSVEVHKLSGAAKAAIEKAGGTVKEL